MSLGLVATFCYQFQEKTKRVENLFEKFTKFVRMTHPGGGGGGAQIFPTSSDVGSFVVKHVLEFGEIPGNEARSDQPLGWKAIKAVFRR